MSEGFNPYGGGIDGEGEKATRKPRLPDIRGTGEGGTTLDWQGQLKDAWSSQFSDYFREMGLDPNIAQTLVNNNFAGALSYIGSNVLNTGGPVDRIQERVSYYTETPQGINQLIQIGLNYIASKSQIPLPTGGGGGRGGGGRGGPSAADIRASFDVDQLSERVNDMSLTYLIKPADNARALASAYVEEIVKNPNQKLDFDTYVMTRLKKDPRWNTIYKFAKNMNPAVYLNQYVQTANATLGGGMGFTDPADVAFQGAALGASGDAFRGLVERQRAVTSGSEYLNKLDERVRGVAGVLR